MATSTQRKTIQEHYTEMKKHGEVSVVKTVKSTIFGLILLGLAHIAIQAGADPRTVFLGTVAGVLMIFGVEFGELRALQSLTNLRVTVESDENDQD